MAQQRLRKLNEENKQLARDLKERMDNMRGVVPAVKAVKKRALDSEFSSARGSEDRQLSVAATGRGHKRGRDNEIEKVGARSPWLEAFPLQEDPVPARTRTSEMAAPRKRLRLIVSEKHPHDRKDAAGRTTKQEMPTRLVSLGTNYLETPPVSHHQQIQKLTAWTEHGKDQPTTSYERRHTSSSLSSLRTSPEKDSIDETYWNSEASLLSNVDENGLLPRSRVVNKPLDRQRSVIDPVPAGEAADAVIDELLYAVTSAHESSTMPEHNGDSPLPVIAQTLLPDPATVLHRLGPRHRRAAAKNKDLAARAGIRTKLQATESRYARKKKSLNGAGAHPPLPAKTSRKKLHPKLSPMIYNPSRLQFFSDVPPDVNIVIAGNPGNDQRGELMHFDPEKDTRQTRPQFTDNHQQEEAFHSRPAVKITVPDHLKSILVDDWENVTKNLSLTPVPNPHPVFEIIDTYFEEKKGQRRLGSAEADILEEVVQGMKDYFNDCLGKILLYRFERQQYLEVRQSIDKGLEGFKDKSMGEIYGAEHLCRLIGKLYLPLCASAFQSLYYEENAIHRMGFL